jgi:epoxyqueuosine reductase
LTDNDLRSALAARAAQLGFNLTGVTRAEPSPRLDAYLRWIESGMHGEMGYLARPDRVIRRRDLSVILPEVRSLIVVGMDYHALNIPADVLNDPSRGRIAAYAWGMDYHDHLAPRMEQLAAWLRDAVGDGSFAHRVYVDTGAILERSHGQQAGLGFTGKNTLLINPRRGSYFFLGVILTTYPFAEYDTPHRESMCGSCTRCGVACPTNAFPRPYVLDARRCISYLTIEHKGSIDPELRPLIGNWIMGCDVCQDVCPFNRFATPTHEPAFFPQDLEHRLDRIAPKLVDLLQTDSAAFAERFTGTPIKRIGYERLMRNVCIAAGNWGSPDAIPLLEEKARHPSPLISDHAQWAIRHINSQSNT